MREMSLNLAKKWRERPADDESENVSVLISSSSRLVLDSSTRNVHDDASTVVELE